MRRASRRVRRPTIPARECPGDDGVAAQRPTPGPPETTITTAAPLPAVPGPVEDAAPAPRRLRGRRARRRTERPRGTHRLAGAGLSRPLAVGPGADEP